jgi:hypothetical protein
MIFTSEPAVLLLIKVVAFQLGLFAAIVSYLCSKQQHWLLKPLPKLMAWSLFCFSCLLSTILLCALYHPLAASIVTLVIVILNWVVLAVCAPYLSQWRVFVAVCSFLLVGTALMGGAHVG